MNLCECIDPGCPEHKGKGSCQAPGKTLLYRIDTDDETGIFLCDRCAEDAMDSGVFVQDDDEDPL